jgi:hypothetical protein
MIQDEAIKCRYCHSDLTIVPASAETATEPAADESTSSGPFSSSPAASPTPAHPVDEPTAAATEPAEPSTDAQPVQTSSVRYTHSGYRYVLGYGADFFGIWDRQAPSVAAERFPRTDDGWRQAWLRFSSLEPNHTTVPVDAGTSTSTSTGGVIPASTMTMTPQPGAALDPNDVAAVQYTHSGTRYLLGYGRTFFGIWDRQAPERPVQRYSRDDAGWAEAWSSYTKMESNFSEVKLG